MKSRPLLLKQIDRQIKPWQTLRLKQSRPKMGWVRTLRIALGMTLQELASRVGVEQGRIIQIEKAEIEGGLTLRSLKSVAHALNCELIYALVPKTSLENMLKARAEQVACVRLERVAHSMALEAQSLPKKQKKEQFAELVKSLLEDLLKNYGGNNYLKALRAADRHDYTKLLKFVRS